MSDALVDAAKALAVLSDAVTAFATNSALLTTTTTSMSPPTIDGFTDAFKRQLAAGDALRHMYITVELPTLSVAPSKPKPKPKPKHAYNFGPCVEIHDDRYGGVAKYHALINDAEALANVVKITISGIKEITDVSMFRHVETIMLTHLDNVVDVSALGGGGTSGVKDLSLRCMDSVKSLAGLGGLKRLELYQCRNKNLTSLGAVKTVDTLEITYMGHIQSLDDFVDGNTVRKFVCACAMWNVSDVSALRNAEEVELTGMGVVMDVSPLCNVKKLTLTDMKWVECVSALRGVEDLTLDKMPLVRDVSALHDIKKLRLFHLANVVDISMLRGVDDLYVRGLPKVMDISALVQTVPALVVQECGCHGVIINRKRVAAAV